MTMLKAGSFDWKEFWLMALVVVASLGAFALVRIVAALEAIVEAMS